VLKRKFDTFIESTHWGSIRFNRSDLRYYEIFNTGGAIELALHFDDGTRQMMWTGETASYPHVKEYVETMLGVG